VSNSCFQWFTSGKAPDRRKRRRAGGFRLWKAMKCVFCCCSCSVGNVVEPFVDPEPSSPAPDHSGVEPNDGQSTLTTFF